MVALFQGRQGNAPAVEPEIGTRFCGLRSGIACESTPIHATAWGMKKLVERLLWIPLFLVAVVFMVANRQEVAVSLNPFADGSGVLTSVALPLWAWFMMMIGLGVALGSLGMWISAASGRRKARDLRQQVKGLEKQVVRARESAHMGQSAGETLPVLTSE